MRINQFCPLNYLRRTLRIANGEETNEALKVFWGSSFFSIYADLTDPAFLREAFERSPLAVGNKKENEDSLT